MRILAGVPREVRQLLSNDCNASTVTVNFNMCTYLFTLGMCAMAMPTGPFRQSSIRPTMKSIIHRAIGL